MTSAMTSGPTFSVIIPTFRRPDLLEEAVASVLAQTRPDWECLIVDDGGGQVIEPPDPRVRVVSRPASGGPAAARNTGVAEAAGRWLTFLDDDDRYTPERLELAAAGLGRAPVAVCWTRWFDPTAPAAPAGPARGRWLVGNVADTILDSTTPHLGSTAVAAEAMVPFDVRYRALEDVEWWLRMAEQCSVDTIAALGCEIRRHGGVRANQTDVASRTGAQPPAPGRAGRLVRPPRPGPSLPVVPHGGHGRDRRQAEPGSPGLPHLDAGASELGRRAGPGADLATPASPTNPRYPTRLTGA